jgi:hypothetical protein
MSAATESEEVKRFRALEHFEIVVTILLALATVATAWSSYQANRWNGEQAKAGARASALRIESSKAAALGNAFAEVDVITFTQWVGAYANDDTALTEFWVTRFRPEFGVAFDAWIATDPFENPDAPLTPFAMDEYVRASDVEAEELERQSEEAAATAREYLQRSSNYVLGVVLFAAALFFAGLSTRFRTRGPRLAVLTIGCVVFAATLIWIATFPVSVSV